MPTVQGTDTFDHGFDVPADYDAVFGTPTAVTTPLWREKLNSLEINSPGNEGVRKTVTGAPTRGWLGLAIRVPGAPSGASTRLARISNPADVDLDLWISTGGALFVALGADISTAVPISAGEWYWIEMILDVSGTTFEGRWRINGVDRDPVSAAAGAASTIDHAQVVSLSGDGTLTWHASYWQWGSAASLTDWLGPPLPASNSFEGGSDETTISTSNSGATSGDLFDIVTIAGASGLKYDTARAAHGGVSARVDASFDGIAQVGWSFSSKTEIWRRVYVYLTAAPPQHLRLVGWEHVAGGVAPGRILINTFDGGVVQVLDSNFVGDFATAVIPKNEWIRIEYRLVCHPTSGIIEAKMFQADSTSPITNGTVTSTGRDTETAVDRATYGHNTGWPSGTMTFWMDDLNVNAVGYPGPASAQARPFANVTIR